MKGKMILALVLAISAGAVFALENDGVFTHKVGRFEVSVLVESERAGDVSIVPGAGEDVPSRYNPSDGFVMSTNIFLIKTPERTILVDTAFGGESFNRLRRMGVELEQIDTVLITHMHGDHIGGLQRNGRAVFPNARVYISARDLDHFTRIAVNPGAVAAVAPYGTRLQTFEPSVLNETMRDLLPGITPIAAYGHTPGHTVFLIESEGERFLIIGDLLLVAPVQFPRPGVSATFDMDRNAAAATRRQILDYAARTEARIAGTHIAYPGSGTVRLDSAGFSFTPAK